ncbi:MAG: carbohydrate ABC transporter permease [bacterium]
MKWRRKIIPYLFISPFLIGFAVFGVYPIVYALRLSLLKQVGIGVAPKFVGLGNYIQLWRDERFLRSLFNTSYYAAGSVFIIVPLALLLALILGLGFLKFKHFFRLFFFVPVITSSVVVSIIFTLVLDDRYGLLNNVLLVPLGLPRLRWLLEPMLIMPSIILIGIWRWTGLNALYFIAGLRNIPKELEEAAAIDGANRWQIFIHVTIPLLRPVLLFVVVLAIIGSYNLFGEAYLLLGQSGGPSDAGLFMTVYLYLTGFRSLKFGYASAIGYTMVVIIFILSLIQLKVLGAFRET